MAKSNVNDWEFETRVAPQACAKPPLKPFGRTTYPAPQAAGGRATWEQTETVVLRVPPRTPTPARHYAQGPRAVPSMPASAKPASSPSPSSMSPMSPPSSSSQSQMATPELARVREHDRRPLWALLGIVFAILCIRLIPIAAARLMVVSSSLSTHAEP